MSQRQNCGPVKTERVEKLLICH